MRKDNTRAKHNFFEEFSNFINLKKEYYKLLTVEKGSTLVGNFLLILCSLLFGSFALLCLSFALAFYLGELLHGYLYGFLIIMGVYLLLIAILVIFKEALLINPMVRMMHKSIYKNDIIHEEVNTPAQRD